MGAGQRRLTVLVGCAVILGLVSFGIEVLQIFTPTRTPDLADATSLAVGGLGGVALAYWLSGLRSRYSWRTR